MLSHLFEPSNVFPAFSSSVSRKKYFTVNFVLPFSVLVFCAQGLIAQEQLSASYLLDRKEMAAFAMAALVFRTNINFWPINADNSQYSDTKNNPDTSLRLFNHLPGSQQKGCFSKVPKGDTEQLLNVLLTSPPGCTVEIEGTYFLDASIDIKVNLTGKSSLQEPEPDEPAVFFRIESALTDSDQKTGFRSSVLSGNPLSYTRYPEAVLVMDENKDSRLRIHPSAKLNNITVRSPSTDFDPHRGCIDTRIIFQGNAEPFIVGVSESASGHLCHTRHSPSSGIISYGETSTGTTTKQNSNNSGGKGVVRRRSCTNAPHTASKGGSSSSGAGGDDRRPWNRKTLIQCLADIIQASPEQKLKVSEIYKRYHEVMGGNGNYNKRSKENSIRYTLSINRCFQLEASTQKKGGLGGGWSYVPSLRRQSVKIGRSRQQPVINRHVQYPTVYCSPPFPDFGQYPTFGYSTPFPDFGQCPTFGYSPPFPDFGQYPTFGYSTPFPDFGQCPVQGCTFGHLNRLNTLSDEVGQSVGREQIETPSSFLYPGESYYESGESYREHPE